MSQDERIYRNDDHQDFTEEDFNNVLEKLKKKSKEKYKFILMAGKSMQNVLYKLFQNIWKQEKKTRSMEIHHYHATI